MWCFVRPPKYHWRHLATLSPPQYHCTTEHASAVGRCWLPRCDAVIVKGGWSRNGAELFISAIGLIYGECCLGCYPEAIRPGKALFISFLCTLRRNVNFFPMYSAWECSFLPDVLCVGMFISSLCTPRGNFHFFPTYSARECSFLPYVLCVGMFISPLCSLR